jgi:hypothetical protein
MLNEEEERGSIHGVGPSSIRIEEEELVELKGRKDSPHKEVGGMTYAA